MAGRERVRRIGMTSLVEIFVGLLMTVAILGLVARRLTIPYPVLFVVGGAVLGFVPELPQIQLKPELVFLFFLPPLLFPAALFTSLRDFRANLRPISLLAVGLVLFTTVTVAYCAHYFMGLPLTAGFVLGAIVSPPDAIAATAIAERLRVPRRIVTILEGESLVNDATALVAYQFAVAAVVTGSFSLAHASVRFVFVSVGGVVVGLATGWLARQFHCRVDDPPIEITVSLLTPFVAYLLAEAWGASGVLAVVAAGLYLGWFMPELLNFRTRLQGGPVWEMVEFLLNGAVFVLIGLQLPQMLRGLAAAAIPVRHLVQDALLISLAVIVIRMVWVFPATYVPRLISKRVRARDPYPKWQHVTVVAWTGMRGVVSLAAALALPTAKQNGSPFPGRDLILFLTFVVIFATLVVQGLSLPFLIRQLKIQDDRSIEKEEHEARLAANREALARLNEIGQRGGALTDAWERLRTEYEDHIRQLETADPRRAGPSLRRFSDEFEQLSREALRQERETILRLRNEEVINDEVLRRVQRDIDLAEARLAEHQ